MQKSWLSILFDLFCIIFVSWAVIHYKHLMDDANEQIQVIRYGVMNNLGQLCH